MAVAIGGRVVAIYRIGGIMNAVNQSSWQAIATTVAGHLGDLTGFTPGAGINVFIDAVSDGTNNYVRIVIDDVQVTDGTSVATAAATFATTAGSGASYTNLKNDLMGFSSLGASGITFASVSFEPWGDGFTPGPPPG